MPLPLSSTLQTRFASYYKWDTERSFSAWITALIFFFIVMKEKSRKHENRNVLEKSAIVAFVWYNSPLNFSRSKNIAGEIERLRFWIVARKSVSPEVQLWLFLLLIKIFFIVLSTFLSPLDFALCTHDWCIFIFSVELNRLAFFSRKVYGINIKLFWNYSCEQRF